MKYLLIEKGESEDGARVVICKTEIERNRATIAAIFGEVVEPFQEEEALKCLDELKERGTLSFEGDPGLAWLDACEVVQNGLVI